MVNTNKIDVVTPETSLKAGVKENITNDKKNIPPVKNYYINRGRKIFDLCLGLFVGTIFYQQLISLRWEGKLFGNRLDFYTGEFAFQWLGVSFIIITGLFFLIRRKFISIGLLASIFTLFCLKIGVLLYAVLRYVILVKGPVAM
jgi:hypothetical protein